MSCSGNKQVELRMTETSKFCDDINDLFHNSLRHHQQKSNSAHELVLCAINKQLWLYVWL